MPMLLRSFLPLPPKIRERKKKPTLNLFKKKINRLCTIFLHFSFSRRFVSLCLSLSLVLSLNRNPVYVFLYRLPYLLHAYNFVYTTHSHIQYWRMSPTNKHSNRKYIKKTYEQITQSLVNLCRFSSKRWLDIWLPSLLLLLFSVYIFSTLFSFTSNDAKKSELISFYFNGTFVVVMNANELSHQFAYICTTISCERTQTHTQFK